jgi:hypothetical protein
MLEKKRSCCPASPRMVLNVNRRNTESCSLRIIDQKINVVLIGIADFVDDYDQTLIFWLAQHSKQRQFKQAIKVTSAIARVRGVWVGDDFSAHNPTDAWNVRHADRDIG